MSSVNKAILIGRLGMDPVLKSVGASTVCNFNLATDESYTDKNGQKVDKTEWHRVVVWGKQAESCGKYLSKGSLVYVEGSLATREWEKDGTKHQTTEVKAESVRFLSPRSDAPRQGQGSGAPQRSEPQRPPRPPYAGPAQRNNGNDDIPF